MDVATVAVLLLDTIAQHSCLTRTKRDANKEVPCSIFIVRFKQCAERAKMQEASPLGM